MKGRDHLRNLSKDSIILKWIPKKYGIRVQTGFIWPTVRASGRIS
jgi:hypothetical protein